MKNVNLERLAIDNRERAILNQIGQEGLAMVAEVKKIFGHDSRVISHKPGEKQKPVYSSFLSRIFHETKGLIEIRCLPSRAQLFSRDMGEIERFIESHMNENVFFGVCTRRTTSGTESDVLEVPCLWADLDFKDYPGGRAEAETVMGKFPLKPSIIVSSGHGFHLYWILNKPIQPTLEVKARVKGIAKALNADASVFDLARVLRVPGTFNRKNGEELLVNIIEDNQ